MSIKKQLIINFLSGPGCLKSGIASGVFSLLKLHYVNCELVTEYPKDLTWEENWKSLAIQGSVFGEQNKRLVRIGDAVDVIITDTSLLGSLIYRREDLTEEFETYVMSVYNSYDNLNINLIRNEDAVYEDFGRTQDLTASIEIDNIVKAIINQYDLNCIELEPSYKAVNKITSLILKRFDKELRFKLEKV